jgi:beta propeller repeat protein
MGSRVRRTALIVIMVVGLLPFGALSAFGERAINDEYPLVVAPGGQVQPDADWPYVAYKDGRYDYMGVGEGEPHIRVYNMETGRDFAVTPQNKGLWEQSNPAVSGTRVVYSDQRNYDETECDIYMYDIATGLETLICDAPNGQGNPYIYGDIVTWNDWRSSPGTIWMKNLKTGETRAAAPGPGNQRESSVWEDYIVWRDERTSPSGGSQNIYMYDIASDEATCVAEGVYYYNPNPPYDYEYVHNYDPHVGDGKVVFNEYSYGWNGSSGWNRDTIKMYDIATGEVTDLRDPSATDSCWHPVVSDGWVTWTDRRSGAMEVWGYDIANEEEVLLVAAEFGSGMDAVEATADGEKLTLEELEAAAEVKATISDEWFKYAGRSTTDAGWVYWHDHRPWDGDDSKADLYAKYLGTGTVSTQKMPLQGATRYQTAIDISRESFPLGADTVVIATGKNWPDALTGAPLASAYGGPILLVDQASPAEVAAGAVANGVAWQLPADVAAEIERLGASYAIILGGENAVPANVEQALWDQFGIESTRLGGEDRFETACLIAEELVLYLDEGWDGTAFVTTGRNFPDALAASPLAAWAGWPVFLSESTGLLDETEACMGDLGVETVIVLGGSVAVPLEVGSQVAALGVVEDERIGGSNRYDTAAKIAKWGVDELGMSVDTVGIATGDNYPDALALGAALGPNGNVMMLTSPSFLPAQTKAALEANKEQISQVRYAGGLVAISQAVRNAIAACLY